MVESLIRTCHCNGAPQYTHAHQNPRSAEDIEGAINGDIKDAEDDFDGKVVNGGVFVHVIRFLHGEGNGEEVKAGSDDFCGGRRISR